MKSECLALFQTSFLIGLCMSQSPGRVLLVSFDGLRWDFPAREELPSLRKMVDEGVSVEYIVNVFPTNTYPNHHSIITGLYPENHGIIDNEMYNDTDGGYFRARQSDGKWYQEAETIWNTNQNSGYRSGGCYYPGSDIEIQGMRPTFSTVASVNKNYISSFKNRIDLIMDWLTNGSDVTFVASYFDYPDLTAHKVGPLDEVQTGSDVWEASLKLINNVVEYLFAKLEEKGLKDDINVIITGDHGASLMTEAQVIDVKKCLGNPRELLKTALGLSYVSLYPKEGRMNTILQKLTNCNPNFETFLKEDIPEELRIKQSSRTAPLVLLANEGYVINTGMFNATYGMNFPRGEHGYRNNLRDMNPAFVAVGPAFKRGYRKEYIETVDLYNLMCSIIGIKPSANDGIWSRVAPLLK